MKNLFISLSLLTLSLLAVACKKESDVDPRDQYIGTYSMLATTTVAATGNTSSIGFLTTADGYIDVSVEKGRDANQLKFSISPELSLVATLDEGTFYMPPQATPAKTADGFSYYKNYEGDGAFSGNKLTFNYSLSATTNQVKAKQVTTLRGKRK